MARRAVEAQSDFTDARGADAARPASFEEALDAVRGIRGWLSDEQARMLFDRARRVRPGSRLVEIGSYHGRSCIVLAKAAPEGVEIVAVDPFARPERTPHEALSDVEAGDRDLQEFEANLQRAGVRSRVHHVRELSSRALDHVPGSVDLLYVDGSHEFAPARDDLRDWGARVREGGTLLVHDAFSSVGVTLAQLAILFVNRDFRYLGRSRSLAEYRRERLSLLGRLANAGRQAAQLPWFGRNVAVKLAMSLGARPVVRLLGHTDDTFPY
jgi:predicted O-methyltransferase YrrM